MTLKRKYEVGDLVRLSEYYSKTRHDLFEKYNYNHGVIIAKDSSDMWYEIMFEDGNILDVLNHHIEPTFGKFKLLKEKNEDNN